VTGQERLSIVKDVATDPEKGDLIQGTGGLRKRRVAGRGKGKSGGYRVIVAYVRDTLPAYLLALYGKDDQPDLTPDEKKAAAKMMKELKSTS
jgi:hypothetical protein